jgi:integration host factor subunit alpha
MNRSQLTEVIYRRHGGISRREASELVNLILDRIKDRLLEGEGVEISGFGTFRIRRKQSRKGRNPRTGEKLVISARRALVFRPSRVLKDELNS